MRESFSEEWVRRFASGETVHHHHTCFMKDRILRKDGGRQSEPAKKPKVGLGWSNKFGPLWYNGDRPKMLDDPGVFERGSERPWPFESNTKTREE